MSSSAISTGSRFSASVTVGAAIGSCAMQLSLLPDRRVSARRGGESSVARRAVVDQSTRSPRAVALILGKSIDNYQRKRRARLAHRALPVRCAPRPPGPLPAAPGMGVRRGTGVAHCAATTEPKERYQRMVNVCREERLVTRKQKPGTRPEEKPMRTTPPGGRRLLAIVAGLLVLGAAPAGAQVLDLEKLDGPTAIKMMEEGKLTSVRLVRAYIERIDALNKRGPGLNAVAQLNEDALEEAEQLDKERRQGLVRGPAPACPCCSRT
jgi:hypothetical protein